MKKALIIAGALLLATSANSAFAHGNGRYAQNSYRDYVQQLRACRQHERLHEALGAEHADEHAQGLPSNGDHQDLHGAIDQAHDAYHADHPRSDFCDAMGNNQTPYGAYQNPYGYGGASGQYGYGYGYGR